MKRMISLIVISINFHTWNFTPTRKLHHYLFHWTKINPILKLWCPKTFFLKRRREFLCVLKSGIPQWQLLYCLLRIIAFSSYIYLYFSNKLRAKNQYLSFCFRLLQKIVKNWLKLLTYFFQTSSKMVSSLG